MLHPALQLFLTVFSDLEMGMIKDVNNTRIIKGSWLVAVWKFIFKQTNKQVLLGSQDQHLNHFIYKSVLLMFLSIQSIITKKK